MSDHTPSHLDLERLIAESRSKARAEHERELEPTPEPDPQPKPGAVARVLGLFRRH